MPRFKVVFENLGKDTYENVEACDKKEAIEKVCDKFDIGYESIIAVEER